MVSQWPNSSYAAHSDLELQLSMLHCALILYNMQHETIRVNLNAYLEQSNLITL